MTNKDFFNAYRGEPVLYKGNDIGAYVAGYVEEKYIILGFYDDKGCILAFNTGVNVDEVYESYRFTKLKYLKIRFFSNFSTKPHILYEGAIFLRKFNIKN